MTKSPILNALIAALYIMSLVGLISLFADSEVERVLPFFMPIVVLSLFTLSAAFMGYTFFMQPFRMYFEGQKEQAIMLAAQTIGAFAVITIVLLGIILLAVYNSAYLLGV